MLIDLTQHIPFELYIAVWHIMVSHNSLFMHLQMLGYNVHHFSFVDIFEQLRKTAVALIVSSLFYQLSTPSKGTK